ncbi:hypothetical protein U8527_19980 [Kordia algicida OT-1]|uniref:Uncharacterized protein n=1 Tax=Kordia algicida OT-1 TaxID=391587 RepID=A9DKA5_9FLAO|nr:hypothetical protein [Kordia algicida]EDP98286.1 hypothetical protein KAOT1_13752 [Kordia algicida OT-1]
MKYALEKTTNTHILEAENIKVRYSVGSTQVLQIEGEGIVSHGEHGIIKTESKYVIKYVQQEFNPVTRIIENAFD